MIPIMTIFKRSYDYCLSTFQFQILYGEWHVVGLHKERALREEILFPYKLYVVEFQRAFIDVL